MNPAVELLREMLEYASWFPSAVEIDTYTRMPNGEYPDGEDWHARATKIVALTESPSPARPDQMAAATGMPDTAPGVGDSIAGERRVPFSEIMRAVRERVARRSVVSWVQGVDLGAPGGDRTVIAGVHPDFVSVGPSGAEEAVAVAGVLRKPDVKLSFQWPGLGKEERFSPAATRALAGAFQRGKKVRFKIGDRLVVMRVTSNRKTTKATRHKKGGRKR